MLNQIIFQMAQSDQKVILAYGELDMGKQSFIETLSGSAMLRLEPEYNLALHRLVKPSLTLIDMNNTCGLLFEEGDLQFLLQFKYKNKYEELQNGEPKIDCILIFQSMQESVIQLEATRSNLKKIFPTLISENIVCVITEWEKDIDQRKLEYTINEIDGMGFRYIKWLDSCSSNYNTYKDSQVKLLISLINETKQIQLEGISYKEEVEFERISIKANDEYLTQVQEEIKQIQNQIQLSQDPVFHMDVAGTLVPAIPEVENIQRGTGLSLDLIVLPVLVSSRIIPLVIGIGLGMIWKYQQKKQEEIMRLAKAFVFYRRYLQFINRNQEKLNELVF